MRPGWLGQRAVRKTLVLAALWKIDSGVKKRFLGGGPVRAVGVPKACNLDLGNDSGDGERWIDKLEFGASNNPFTEGTESRKHASCPAS